MKKTARIIFLYALIVLIGGILGYSQAKSLVSLVMGSAFAALLFLSSFFVAKGKKAACFAALVLTILLDGFFTYRFSQTAAFFPAGAMSLLSTVTMMLLAVKMRRLFVLPHKKS